MTSPPLSLYVHLPWCVKKCPYCDFNSYSLGQADPRSRYLDALTRDLALEAARVPDRPLTSIFLGGGTPSLFSPAEIGRVLDCVAQHYRLADDIEITMEANPGTVECGTPAGYRRAGVNRLSIGAQSFSPAALSLLGRIHSSDDIVRAFGEARDAGFEQINLDVMYGLPQQGIDAALADIEQALALEPPHFSWYQLTLEPNTVFYARPPAGLPDNDLSLELQMAGQALLASRGYEQYEVSAYARPGARCRHNLNYWQFGDYLAAGAGAHGKLTIDGAVRRYAKPANPQAYMALLEDEQAAEPMELAPPLSDRDLCFEFLLNALRLADGFDERLFVERTGLPATVLSERAGRALARGLISRNDAGIWRPTERGRDFLDDLAGEFLD